MIRIVLFFILSGLAFQSSSQNIGFYNDPQNHFFVFDNGITKQIDHRRVVRTVVGKDYLFYENEQGDFMFYQNGETSRILGYYPSYLATTRNFAIAEIGGLPHYLDNGTFKNLTLENNMPIAAGDSIIAFIAYDDYLNVYENGKKKEITGPYLNTTFNDDIGDFFKVSSNTLAYYDLEEKLNLLYKGKNTEIENRFVNNFWVGDNLITYVNDFDELIVYDNGSSQTLEDRLPLKVMVGNKFVAYLNDEEEFYTYYEGLTEEYDLNTVDIRVAKDDIVAWVDANNDFYYWKNGEAEKLENFAPKFVKADLNHLIYTDINGRLKGIYDNKKVNITDQIVRSFDIYGNVILYTIDDRNTGVYWKGNTY